MFLGELGAGQVGRGFAARTPGGLARERLLTQQYMRREITLEELNYFQAKMDREVRTAIKEASGIPAGMKEDTADLSQEINTMKEGEELKGRFGPLVSKEDYKAMGITMFDYQRLPASRRSHFQSVSVYIGESFAAVEKSLREEAMAQATGNYFLGRASTKIKRGYMPKDDIGAEVAANIKTAREAQLRSLRTAVSQVTRPSQIRDQIRPQIQQDLSSSVLQPRAPMLPAPQAPAQQVVPQTSTQQFAPEQYGKSLMPRPVASTVPPREKGQMLRLPVQAGMFGGFGAMTPYLPYILAGTVLMFFLKRKRRVVYVSR